MKMLMKQCTEIRIMFRLYENADETMNMILQM
jgi:hypothetical protein